MEYATIPPVMTFLDSYCERAGQGALWAEPLNALSNLAFIFAAFLAFRSMRTLKPRHFADGYMLGALLFSIGVGSGIWHLDPTPLTIMLDVIPITLFINFYLVAFLKRGFHWRWWQAFIGFVALQALNGAAAVWFSPDTLHGTIMYLPTYGMLLWMAGYARWRHSPHAPALFSITLLWTLSLVFRTIDIPICAALPIGTHFLWHLLNAVVLYRLLQLLVKTCFTSSNKM